MIDDERAIRDVVATWLAASRNGEISKVLSLMTDDVIFMGPGQEPFGKETFAAMSEGIKGARIEAESDIQEIRVIDDWAYLRSHITMTIISADGGPSVSKSGYTLTILRRESDKQWRVARDANLLTREKLTNRG